VKVIAELAGTIVKVGETRTGVPVKVDYIYDPEADPLSITAVFHHLDSENAPVVWTFSRELLDAGIDRSTWTGEGDVKFRRLGGPHGRLIMSLDNTEGYAEVALTYRTVHDFLVATFEEVKLGEEEIEGPLDAELERILNS
jgi:hypothetical protein